MMNDLIKDILDNECSQDPAIKDKMYFLQGKKPNSVKCVFNSYLYYQPTDCEDTFYCAYRKDPCYAKVYRSEDKYTEIDKHICNKNDKRAIDHLALNKAENAISRLCKETDLSFPKILQLVSQRLPNCKLTFDGFRERMKKSRTSRYVEHSNVKDFMQALVNLDVCIGEQIVENGEFCTIIQTPYIVQCCENSTVLYIDDHHKMTFQNFDIKIMTFGVEVDKKACIAFYAIYTKLTSSLRLKIFEEIKKINSFKNLKLIIGPYCCEMLEDVRRAFEDVEFTSSWVHFIEILVEKWVELEIGHVSQHILSYFACIPLIPPRDYFNAVRTIQDMVHQSLTDQTEQFVKDICDTIIWGTNFVPLFDSIHEKSNDLIELNNIRLRTKLLNSKFTEEFIDKINALANNQSSREKEVKSMIQNCMIDTIQRLNKNALDVKGAILQIEKFTRNFISLPKAEILNIKENYCLKELEGKISNPKRKEGEEQCKNINLTKKKGNKNPTGGKKSNVKAAIRSKSQGPKSAKKNIKISEVSEKSNAEINIDEISDVQNSQSDNGGSFKLVLDAPGDSEISKNINQDLSDSQNSQSDNDGSFKLVLDASQDQDYVENNINMPSSNKSNKEINVDLRNETRASEIQKIEELIKSKIKEPIVIEIPTPTLNQSSSLPLSLLFQSANNPNAPSTASRKTTELSSSPPNSSKDLDTNNPNATSAATKKTTELSSSPPNSSKDLDTNNPNATSAATKKTTELSSSPPNSSKDLEINFKTENSKDRRTMRSQLFKLLKNFNDERNYSKCLFCSTCISDCLHSNENSLLNSKKQLRNPSRTSSKSKSSFRSSHGSPKDSKRHLNFHESTSHHSRSAHLPNHFKTRTNLHNYPNHASNTQNLSRSPRQSRKDSKHFHETTSHRSRSPHFKIRTNSYNHPNHSSIPQDFSRSRHHSRRNSKHFHETTAHRSRSPYFQNYFKTTNSTTLSNNVSNPQKSRSSHHSPRNSKQHSNFNKTTSHHSRSPNLKTKTNSHNYPNHSSNTQDLSRSPCHSRRDSKHFHKTTSHRPRSPHFKTRTNSHIHPNHSASPQHLSRSSHHSRRDSKHFHKTTSYRSRSPYVQNHLKTTNSINLLNKNSSNSQKRFFKSVGSSTPLT
ncbi:uncharacterized protein LOC127289290 isoform X6 [Leptopilina boulardi]|uniref:uncharacterized protein LOC127289290 isoform X6 n=1 Tax=Leptopilina boulardi TaxID=63433 RepID=UPI0021F5DEEF|nr:uncharacterized protein LOC127289290 isoform X6 [Leptopilina boulardi]